MVSALLVTVSRETLRKYSIAESNRLNHLEYASFV